ncbi:hypothetical protein E5288_WYG016412 [Bos mutus]|uniref:Uncharacterized protein n=1 Tax=Bos mutus TaxID=72004 RepID=A0A6B0R6B2_9CETA|nr:hypothetical protein [Bos mutus]
MKLDELTSSNTNFIKFDPYDFVCTPIHLRLLISYLVNHYVVDLSKRNTNPFSMVSLEWTLANSITPFRTVSKVEWEVFKLTSELEPIPADQGAAEMTVGRGMASDEWSDVYANTTTYSTERSEHFKPCRDKDLAYCLNDGECFVIETLTGSHKHCRNFKNFGNGAFVAYFTGVESGSHRN